MCQVSALAQSLILDKLTLADIQALGASGDYGGTRLLTANSAALAFSAALFLDNLKLWKGASYFLTDDEIDTIQEMIAQMENDIIVEYAPVENGNLKSVIMWMGYSYG